MKKLVAAFVLGAMLLTVGVGCSGPTSTSPKPSTDKSKDKSSEKAKESEKPKSGT